MNVAQEHMKEADKWYGKAQVYWENVDPTVDGMLQGYAKISDSDCIGSRKFLNNLKKKNILTAPCKRALDCGAGIGRVSKHFLLKEFLTVDILEQCTQFTDNIKNYMDDEKLIERIENIYNEGMQTFQPKEKHYDVIWIQWVIGHLTDDDFVSFLQRCQKALCKGGCIVLKDNVATGKFNLYDDKDSSVMRALDSFLDIFERAGIKVRENEVQKGFPLQIYPVRMFALT